MKRQRTEEKTKSVLQKVLAVIMLVVFAMLVTFAVNKKDSIMGLFADKATDVTSTIEEVSKNNITEVSGTLANGEGYIECESIIEGAKRLDLPDGKYTLRINGRTNSGVEETKDYAIHFYNFKGDQVWDSNKTFGDSTDIGTANSNATRMVVVRVDGDLIVNSGVTVTTVGTQYGGPKGFTLAVTGNLTNNGNISMSARGAKAQGENVYLYLNNGEYEYVPAVGANGGAAVSAGPTNFDLGTLKVNGIAGVNGTNRATGGGGSGSATLDKWYSSGRKAISGAGSTGTSYSGGSGGGASCVANTRLDSKPNGGVHTAQSGNLGDSGGKGFVYGKR